MKKLLLLLFIVPILAFSQQETKREYYASGKLLSIINYTDGVREGSCKYFYNYGAWAILSESNYKNGKLIGAFKSYYKNSQLEKKRQYQYNESDIYSRQDGTWKYYNKNGQLSRKSIITDGVEELKF
jgi:antitoxin component YwqK of YwqJK toxin-antitoxin module